MREYSDILLFPSKKRTRPVKAFGFSYKYISAGGGGQFIFHIENLHTEKEREYTREEPIEGRCTNDFFFYNVEVAYGGGEAGALSGNPVISVEVEYDEDLKERSFSEH